MTVEKYRPKSIEHCLARLQEEAAEIIVVCSKIERFGADSWHPDDPDKKTNLDLLIMEINDFETARDDYFTAAVGSPWADHITSRNLQIKHLKAELQKYKTFAKALSDPGTVAWDMASGKCDPKEPV